MTTGLIKQLLEAGVHFGHQTKRWNPKMARYIFTQKSGIYIIDLEQTAASIEKACDFLRETVAKGGYILFVGTKRQAQEAIQSEATRCGMFFVNQRWLGGTLTNFETIQKSSKRMNELLKMKEQGLLDSLSKKEAARLGKELDRLSKNLTGIARMDRLPEALFVVDSNREEISVREANKLGIPVVSLVDTNSDPDKIDYVIPGNDDAIRAVKLMTSIIADSIVEGRKIYLKGEGMEEAEQEAKPPPEVESALEGKPEKVKEKKSKEAHKIEVALEEPGETKDTIKKGAPEIDIGQSVEEVLEKKIRPVDRFEAKMKKKPPKKGTAK